VREGIRVLRAVAIGASVLAVLAPAAVARRHHHRTCFPHASHTLLASKTIRVYSQGRPRSFSACRFSDHRTVKLGRERSVSEPVGQQVTFGQFRIAGKFVAFAISTDTDPGTHQDVAKVVNVATGAFVHDVRAPNDYSLRELVLATNGAIAWTAKDELRIADAGGERVVDTGTITALAIAGTTLYWTKDGAAHSTALR
jgi:hypothetical protein